MSVSITYGLHVRLELLMVAEWQNRTCDWCNSWWEGQPHPLTITLSYTQVVLQNAIQDTTNTKRWLYHRWHNIHSCEAGREDASSVRARTYCELLSDKT